ncbi:MAG: DUF2236 domain-containing protein [Chloroflexi bacterium]|nr:DUF2236 domain-containing protein [Chloroflexota bacterium]
MFVLLGGTAALLLQVAHPLVAAGVDAHSDFRRDPFGRLRHTLDTTLAIVFGDDAAAYRAIDRINALHRSVRGDAADGRAYSARDPGLLLWVQSTLVLTSLRLYEATLGHLAPGDREAYWDELRPIARRLGIPSTLLPGTLAELEAYERRMLASEVRPDATAKAVGRDVLRPLGWLPDRLYWPNDAITAALLPPTLREAFGLGYGDAERRFFRGAAIAIRALRPVLPEALTVVPQARRYERTQS